MGTSIPGWSASDCRNSMAADLDEVLYPSTSVRVYVGTLMYNVRNSVDGHPGCFGNIHKARCHGQDLMISNGGSAMSGERLVRALHLSLYRCYNLWQRCKKLRLGGSLARQQWGLGNEMDGPWQMGHKTPEEYARTVTEVSNASHRFDDNPIVATCGSSDRSMPIFGRRERIVADAAFDSLDLVSATPTTNPIDDDFIRLGVVAVGRTRIVVHRDSDPRTNLSC